MSSKDKLRDLISKYWVIQKHTKSEKERSEDSSFSELIFTENNENSCQKQNLFNQWGDLSTLALWGDLYSHGDEDKPTERPCGSEQSKDSDEPEIPIPEVDSYSWEFPNAQRIPSTLTPPSGKMESLNAKSGNSSAMMFEGESKKAGPSGIPGPTSNNDEEEDLIQRKVDEDSQSSTSHWGNELSNSLRVLPDRIT